MTKKKREQRSLSNARPRFQSRNIPQYIEVASLHRMQQRDRSRPCPLAFTPEASPDPLSFSTSYLHVVLAHRFYISSLVGAVVFLIYILPLAAADWREKKRRGICNTSTRERWSKRTWITEKMQLMHLMTYIYNFCNYISVILYKCEKYVVRF